jgi:hypothetical protein
MHQLPPVSRNLQSLINDLLCLNLFSFPQLGQQPSFQIAPLSEYEEIHSWMNQVSELLAASLTSVPFVSTFLIVLGYDPPQTLLKPDDRRRHCGQDPMYGLS